MGNAKEKIALKLSPTINVGREVLLSGAQFLEQIAAELGEDFERAIELLESVSEAGRIVVCGIGKAGFVGMKVSATLASIGAPSFFLHPAEATHGDFGRVTKHDLALIFSNSGETSEILKIIGHFKLLGCKIISVTASKDSSLAKQSDLTLAIGKCTESGPYSVAPTTSTSGMLGLGDAIAMALFSRLGNPKEKFAFFHPGGSLGKALMKISQIMRTGDEHCIMPQSALAKDVLHQITVTKNRPGCASIVDQAGILVGIFTDGNFRRCLDSGTEFLSRPIAEVMGSKPKTISSFALAEDALRIMSEYKIDQLIVVDESFKPIGMVDIQDVI